MKNTQITNLGILVPIEIRLDVYKKALKILENSRKKSRLNSDDGLCLLLPCVLWNLEYWQDRAPDGYHWYYCNTSKSFPELNYSVIEDITSKDKKRERISTRIKYLKQFIENLS